MFQGPAEGAATTSRPGAGLVVAVAATVEDRVRLVNQLGDSGPVLIVSSVAEARELMSATPARAEGPPSPGPNLRSAPGPGVRIHEDRRAVGFGAVEVSLTPLEFALLRQLMSEPGRVWRFDELVRKVWQTDHIGDVSQVHAVVKRLRAKLSQEHAPVVIEAVRGVGFRLTRRGLSTTGEDPLSRAQ